MGLFTGSTVNGKSKTSASRPTSRSNSTPVAWRAGRDPQLEKAVEWLMAELKKNPPKEFKRPPYPEHKGTPLGKP
jgi:hypothetical protein